MKRIRMIALLLFLGLLLGGCARTALETGSWGLSFPNEGESPVGSASSEELRQYDAAFMGNPEEKTLYLTFDLGYEGRLHRADSGHAQGKARPGGVFRRGNLRRAKSRADRAHGRRGTHGRQPHLSPLGHVENRRRGDLLVRAASRRGRLSGGDRTGNDKILPSATGDLFRRKI